MPIFLKQKRSSFSKPLQQLFNMKYQSYKYTELLEVCTRIEIVVTPAMADLVEMETREQANSKLWFTYRAGRVTASKMKSVCCTDSANPSQSLIKGLVYPEAFRFIRNTLHGDVRGHEISMKKICIITTFFK